MRETLNKLGKLFIGTTTAITIHNFYKNNFNNELKVNLAKKMRLSSEYQKKIAELEVEKDNMYNEIIKIKVEDCRSKLETISGRIYSELEKLNKVEGNSELNSSNNESIKQITNDITNNTNLYEQLLNLINNKSSSGSKPWINNNWIDLIKESLDSWNTMLSSLNQTELGALAHLMSAIFISLCLFSIIVIVYSEFLLTYLKIEEKFPKLGRFIKIRRKFQQFYLFINFLLIIITLGALIFVNFTILF